MTGTVSVVWIGFHEEGRFALPAIIESGYDVKAIITLSETAASRRSGVLDYSNLANAHNIPLYRVENVNDASTIALLERLQPDVLCVIGWSQILGAEALHTARRYVIGAHASLLPQGRGSAPINWALIRGWEHTGNTLIRLAEGVDTGDMLAQRKFDISVYDSCATLYEQVAESNASMLLEVLEKISNDSLEMQAQDKGEDELLPRRRPGDGLIVWNANARKVYDFVRALARPYPGAFSYVSGKKVKLWKVSWADEPVDRPSGSVAGMQYSFVPELCAVFIACGSGRIAVHEAEIEGEKSYAGESLIRRFDTIKGFDLNE